MKGRLAVATSHPVGLRRLTYTSKDLTRTYPEVKLDIRFVDSEACYEMLSREEKELDIITLPPDRQPTIYYSDYSEKLWY